MSNFNIVSVLAMAAATAVGAGVGSYGAVSMATPAAVTSQPSVQNAQQSDQPIVEGENGMLAGLTPADYWAAMTACNNYGGVGMDMTGVSEKLKAAKAVEESLLVATIKAAGIDPEKCRKF